MAADPLANAAAPAPAPAAAAAPAPAVPAPSPTPSPAPITSDDLKNLQDAIAASSKAADAARQPLNAINAILQKLPARQEVTSASLRDDLRTLDASKDALTDLPGLLKTLAPTEKLRTDLTGADAPLETALQAVKTKQTNGAAVTDEVKSAIETAQRLQGTNKDLEDQLRKAIPDPASDNSQPPADGSVAQSLEAWFTFADKVAGQVCEKLTAGQVIASDTDLPTVAPDANGRPAAARQVRDRLDASLAGLPEALRFAGSLRNSAAGILKTDATALGVTFTNTKRADFQKQVTKINDALSKTFPDIFDAPAPAAPAGAVASLAPIAPSPSPSPPAVPSAPPRFFVWFTLLTDDAQSSVADVVTAASQVRDAQGDAYLAAEQKRGQLQPVAQQLGRITKQWQAVSVALAEVKSGEPVADEAEKKLEDQQRYLTENLSVLDDLLAGDISSFVGDQVRLFYFTDVERLLVALNQTPIPYDIGALKSQATADALHKQLTEADASLSEALGTVSDVLFRIKRIDGELADAENAASSASRAATNAQIRLNRAKATLATTQSAHGSDANDPAVVAAQALVDQAAKTSTDATATANQAESRHQALEDEKTGLPAQRDKAEQDLSAAQAEVRRLRGQVYALAPEEAQAFAQARDNAVFYVNRPQPDSSDPVKRVFLYAYPDSKIVYIRGPRDDVQRVKDIIAQFDRPAPQALLTLWTLQLNGTATKQMNEAIDTIDGQIQTVRSDTDLIAQALRDAISQEVSRIESNAEKASQDPKVPLGFTLRDRMARNLFYSPEVLRQLGYVLPTDKEFEPNDPKAGGVSLVSGVAASSAAPHAGVTAADIVQNTSDVTGWILPDPADSTTLGEMLFTLSLARNSSRREILFNFLQNLRGALFAPLRNRSSAEKIRNNLEQLMVRLLTESQDVLPPHYLKLLPAVSLTKINADRAKAESLQANEEIIRQRLAIAYKLQDYNPQFPSIIFGNALHRPVGLATDSVDSLNKLYLDGDNTASCPPYPSIFTLGDDGSSSDQKEILLALESKARALLAGGIYTRLKQLSSMPAKQRYSSDGAQTLRKEYTEMAGWLSVQGDSAGGYDDWKKAGWYRIGLKALLEGQKNRTGKPVPTGVMPNDPGALNQMDRSAFQLAQAQADLDPLSRATARVASADDMIKRMINAVDGDLENYLLRPALANINSTGQNSRKSLSLGLIQRESILATNRLVARVDPVANADLSPDQVQDFTGAATQLSDIIQNAAANASASEAAQGKARNVSAGATVGGLAAIIAKNAGASTLGTVGWGLLPFLSALTEPVKKPDDPGGAVYGITSGNLFQVTPIFDPSGQALRFKFDFSATTRVRAPDGTTNPNLPNVERHTVNTEVQLSNLELREVSRFETNAQAGLPVVRAGGVPGLKELPILKDIPLIGYYYRKGGSDAVRQESLILAQTVVYPTVGDIAGLLTSDQAAPPGAEQEPPEAAYLPSEWIRSVTAFNPAPSDVAAPPSTVYFPIHKPATQERRDGRGLLPPILKVPAYGPFLLRVDVASPATAEETGKIQVHVRVVTQPVSQAGTNAPTTTVTLAPPPSGNGDTPSLALRKSGNGDTTSADLNSYETTALLQGQLEIHPNPGGTTNESINESIPAGTAILEITLRDAACNPNATPLARQQVVLQWPKYTPTQPEIEAIGRIEAVKAATTTATQAAANAARAGDVAKDAAEALSAAQPATRLSGPLAMRLSGPSAPLHTRARSAAKNAAALAKTAIENAQAAKKAADALAATATKMQGTAVGAQAAAQAKAARAAADAALAQARAAQKAAALAGSR